MTKPQSFKMTLTFDVDQVTKALNYEFAGELGSPLKTDGRCAGTYNFNKGDNIDVEVVGVSRARDAASFVVTDCVLASIPTLAPGTQALSLFDEHTATVQVSEWGIPSREEGDDSQVKTTVKSLDPLQIDAKDGQWEMSCYLSVMIQKNDENGNAAQVARLFYFDPEMTTGNGGDIVE